MQANRVLSLAQIWRCCCHATQNYFGLGWSLQSVRNYGSLPFLFLLSHSLSTPSLGTSAFVSLLPTSSSLHTNSTCHHPPPQFKTLVDISPHPPIFGSASAFRIPHFSGSALPPSCFQTQPCYFRGSLPPYTPSSPFQITPTNPPTLTI